MEVGCGSGDPDTVKSLEGPIGAVAGCHYIDHSVRIGHSVAGLAVPNHLGCIGDFAVGSAAGSRIAVVGCCDGSQRPWPAC